ncbi:MAG: phosphate acyltransferase PlsX [Chloroflexota bacterium]
MPPPNGTIRIALDSMGGDYAPEETVRGAVQAAASTGVEVILVGEPTILEAELCKYDIEGLPIRVVWADGRINEGEHPAFALRNRPNASVAVATRLLKSGEADAMVSAGSTGATSASAMHFLGVIPGLHRPAVCVPLIGFAPTTVLVDGGANVDCRPQHLLSFAAVGNVYAKKIMNVENPKVALLSVGAEAGKGNRLLQESYPILEHSGLDFIGNIEGHDILSGRANVIVCDGIVGNVLMKFYESLGFYVVRWLRDRLGNSTLAGSVRKLLEQMSAFTRMTRDESDGGGLLWGINGIVHLMHGNSRAHQIEAAIARARHAADADLIGYLKAEVDIIQHRCRNYVKTDARLGQRPVIAATRQGP